MAAAQSIVLDARCGRGGSRPEDKTHEAREFITLLGVPPRGLSGTGRAKSDHSPEPGIRRCILPSTTLKAGDTTRWMACAAR
jgi:hypothetical protein